MRIVLRYFLYAMILLIFFGCSASVGPQEVSQRVEEKSIQRTEESPCSAADPAFLQKDEQTLYRALLKIPYREFEKNMSGYYQLSKINPANKKYRSKFLQYAKNFYRQGGKYQQENYLTIISPKNQISVPLLRRPNTGEFNKIGDIPDQTLVKIIDYSVVKYTASYEGIWYLVEYCGMQGFVSEGWTDSVINDEIVKLLWR